MKKMVFGLIGAALLGLAYAITASRFITVSSPVREQAGKILTTLFPTALVIGLLGIIFDKRKWLAILVTLIAAIFIALWIHFWMTFEF